MPVAMTRDRVIFKGTIDVPLLTTNAQVTFPEPMPGDYDIYFQQPTGGLSVTGVSNKTSTGFTVTLSVNLAGSLTWAAVEKRAA